MFNCPAKFSGHTCFEDFFPPVLFFFPVFMKYDTVYKIYMYSVSIVKNKAERVKYFTVYLDVKMQRNVCTHLILFEREDVGCV